MPFNALLNQTLINILFLKTVFGIFRRQLYFRVLTTYREQRSKFSALTEENLNINFISPKGLKTSITWTDTSGISKTSTAKPSLIGFAEDKRQRYRSFIRFYLIFTFLVNFVITCHIISYHNSKPPLHVKPRNCRSCSMKIL